MKLRTYLILMASAILVPVVLAAAMAVEKVREGERQAALRGLRETVRATSLVVDREIQAAVGALRALGNSEHLETGNFRAFYDQAAALNSFPDVWTLLLDESGRQVLNTVTPFGSPPPPPANPDRVRQALDSQRPYVSDVIVGPVTGRLLTTIYVPARAAGGRKYVVAQAFTVDHWRKTALQPQGQPDWVVAVLDRQGKFVSRSHGAGDYLGKDARPELIAATAGANEGLIRHRTLEGVDSYDAFTHSPLSGWSVAVAAPVDTIEASARQAVLWLLAGVGAALLAAVAAAVVLGRTLVQAIGAASASALSLGRGEKPRTQATSIDEVRTLNAALHAASGLLDAEFQTRKTIEAEREELLDGERASREAAEAQNTAKDDFLAMLGHELRNPLAAISGASTLLALGRADAESTQQYLQIIVRQNRHLSHIVDDLLDVSRLISGKIPLVKEPSNIAVSVEHCVASTRVRQDALGLDLFLEAEEVWVDGDPVRIEQIANNLISNAVKYSSLGGQVRVTVRSSEGRAVIAVSDQGAGMSEKLLPHVFEPFIQGPVPSHRVQSGLGLGLAFVKQLVELHDGQVTAYSEGEGKGSTFEVWLPAVSPPAKAPLQVKAESSSCRVLLVEDVDDVRSMLAQLLRLEGYLVAEAANGSEALRIANCQQLDVGLIDIGLPDMDGYSVATRLRAMAPTRTLPLVALTGYGQEKDRRRAILSGFNEHMTKPVDTDALVALISRLFSTRRLAKH
jgi:signal transduction histidine kinase/CheY-like chemotaxis protein